MDCAAKKARKPPIWTTALLILLLVLAIWLAVFRDWQWGLGGALAFYAFFNIYIFCSIRPRNWEGGILFIGFISAALIFILLFGAIYESGQLIEFKECTQLTRGQESCTPNAQPWDWFYYSTVVFTTLGFGDVTPKLYAGKFVTSIEAIIGMTYGVTAIIIFLGRHSWAVNIGSTPDDKSACLSQSKTEYDAESAAILNILNSQSKELTEIRRQISANAIDTTARLSGLKRWISILAAATLILCITCISMMFAIANLGIKP